MREEGGEGEEVHKTSMATFVGTICTPSALIRQRRQRDLSKFAQRICKATHANFCLCCPKGSGDGTEEKVCVVASLRHKGNELRMAWVAFC